MCVPFITSTTNKSKEVKKERKEIIKLGTTAYCQAAIVIQSEELAFYLCEERERAKNKHNNKYDHFAGFVRIYCVSTGFYVA